MAISLGFESAYASACSHWPKAQRILAHHGLHRCQCLLGDIDSTQVIGEASELEQGGDGHGVAGRGGIVLLVARASDQRLVSSLVS